MSDVATLDDTDRRILDFLAVNARVSNREIGERLGISEGTVRTRIRRLVEHKSIRFTALTPELDIETPTLCYVGLTVDLPKLTETARKLAKLQEVRFVASTLGRFDLFCIVVVDSAVGLTRFVGDKVMPIAGVRHSYTSISTQIVKFDHRWGKVM